MQTNNTKTEQSLIRQLVKRVTNTIVTLKRRLVEPKTLEIFVVMEGGVVHEIINLPPHINVTVIDYDTECVENERLELSPIDGELCVINKW